MSWTYSGNPSASPLDEVRFLLGDTSSTKPQLSDEEITYTITLVYGTSPPSSGNYLPAAYCADALASKYVRLVDKSVGDLHIRYSQSAKQFQELAQKMRTRANLAGVPFYVGGLSLADKMAAYNDPDLLGTAVRIDGMDDVGSLQQETDSRGTT